MDSLQRAYSCRSLLPAEQQIIDALGLTIDEYWEFCRLADCKAKDRGDQYALIPEIVATGEPLTTFQIVSLILGVVSTAASILLQPDLPTPEKAPPGIRTADVRGQTKFADLYSFDSVQDLAALGTIIPLIFAKRQKLLGNTEVVGGIRVKGLLLWSQLLSKGSHQELKMLTTLGLSALGATPDSAGLAIGDQLLRSYQEARYRAYFLDNDKNGGRINVSNSIANSGNLSTLEHSDVFEAYDEKFNQYRPLTCGTRTPSSQSIFGCHSPVSNGHPYFLPYEIVQIFDNEQSLREKRDKIRTLNPELNLRAYPARQGMEKINRANVTSGQVHVVEVGDILTYRGSAIRENPDLFPPHGLDDVNTATDSRLSAADAIISVGDLYLFGGALLKCIDRPATPYEASRGLDREYEFECIEPGSVYFQNADHNPLEKANNPFGQTLQRVDIATVTNNRVCDQTEIGIKSVVFKRIDNFANVNSEPPLEILEDFEKNKQAFSLGRVTTFQNRYSFFELQYRKIKDPSTTAFISISAGKFFGVKGDNPQPQYNTITISHPPGQYEFRLLPVPGSTIDGLYLQPDLPVKQLCLLTGNPAEESRPHVISQDVNDFVVSFSGEFVSLTENTVSNDEFYFKRVEAGAPVTGRVQKLSHTNMGVLPDAVRWQLVESPKLERDAATGELITGVEIQVNDTSQIEARWEGRLLDNRLELGNAYQYDPTDFTTVAATQKFSPIESPDLEFTDAVLSAHHYIETNPNGTLKAAIYGGTNVISQTQDPTLADNFNKIYRVKPDTERTPAEDLGSVSQQTAFNRDLTQGAYYGVWVSRDTELFQAWWNSELVPLSTEGNEVYIDNVAYVRGINSEYVPHLNADVFEIVRKIFTPSGTVRYFQPIQKVEVVEDEPAVYRYALGFYSFDFEKHQFVSGGGPANYTPLTTGPKAYQGNGSGLTVNASSFATGQWQWIVVNKGTGYEVGETVVFQFADGTTTDDLQITEIDVEFIQGKVRPPLNIRDGIADYPKFELEKTSHQDGPEHQVVFVNELVRLVDENLTQVETRYEDLSLLGLRVLAGKDWTSMGQLSAYIKEGIKVERLINDDGTTASLTAEPASTNNFAEIAFNLLVSPRLGAGKRIPRDTIDRDAMTIAAKFCRANNFRFDGVIGERTLLREFIQQNAAFCLLDFSIVGGKFALIPSVPYNSQNFKIDGSADINKSVKALFTDGNMKDMQVSFLPTQERQVFKATVAYRQEKENGFSSQKVLQMRFKDGKGGSDSDPEEFIDLTSFCTNRTHAERLAEHKLMLRKHSEHNISFKTTPSSALSIAPGDYIKVISNASHTNRFNNGSIDQFGGVTSTKKLFDGTYTVFFWRPGQTEVQEGALRIEGGKTGDETFFGSIFTIKLTNEQKRIYKVTSLTTDDDGFVDVTGSFQKTYMVEVNPGVFEARLSTLRTNGEFEVLA